MKAPKLLKSMYSFINKTLTRDYLSVSVSYYMKKSYKAWAQAWIWLRSFFNVFFLRSLPEWAWPPGSTRWWRYTRPPRMTSCCACSEASCAPTRTEWVNWWERLWTTSHGQLQRYFFSLSFIPHSFILMLSACNAHYLQGKSTQY